MIDNPTIIFFFFFFFSISGWIIEVAYRSAKNRHLVNPGFLKGPYLPIYGFGGLLRYLLHMARLSGTHGVAFDRQAKIVGQYSQFQFSFVCGFKGELYAKQ